jgi:hypothetical protein
MDGYKRVRGFGAMIRDVLLQRRMSPWQADPQYGEFRTELALETDELRAIVHWIERGAPRGDGEDLLAAVAEARPEWPLGPPDLVVEMPEQEIPATGLVPYIKHTLQLDLDEDRWVRALDLRPTNPEVLHHGFAFIRGRQEAEVLQEHMARMPPEQRASLERWLAERGGSPENPPPEALEYYEKRAFQGLYAYFAKYTPGEGVEELPEGTGKLLPAKAALLFQLHYTTSGVATRDRPRLGIYFHESKPPLELKVASALNTAFVLPPREREFHASAQRFFDHPFRLYALSPHMHYRGRSMRFTAVLPDESREVLLSVPEYSFDWQTTYELREPRVFPAGTLLVCDGVFDNSRMNEHNPNPDVPVKFGPRSKDEMLLGYAIYTRE